jgi:hypothetical protein
MGERERFVYILYVIAPAFLADGFWLLLLLFGRGGGVAHDVGRKKHVVFTPPVLI